MKVNKVMDEQEQSTSMIRDLYAKYQGAEGQAKVSITARRDAGLALGKALFDLRAQAEVVSGGTTFDGTLKSLDIPRRTAYRWIERYELYVGIRRAKPALEAEVGLPILGLDDCLQAKPGIRKLVREMARAAKAMNDQTFNLGNGGNLTKVAMWAEGCKDREELSEMVTRLQQVKRVVDRTLPVLEAMLEATPSDDQIFARARVRIAAESETTTTTSTVN
jgi:hypothetical protein